jgi:GNAT superfamily N-acetyltransferase
MPYQGHFTWIGMVLVDPEAKRKGIGKTLLNKSIEIARTKGAIRLDATAEGYELTTQLGFRTEFELLRMVRRTKGFGGRRNPVYALYLAEKGSIMAYCLGHQTHPGIMEKQFAIAGPEIG